jgi:hypothetical protein
VSCAYLLAFAARPVSRAGVPAQLSIDGLLASIKTVGSVGGPGKLSTSSSQLYVHPRPFVAAPAKLECKAGHDSIVVTWTEVKSVPPVLEYAVEIAGRLVHVFLFVLSPRVLLRRCC